MTIDENLKYGGKEYKLISRQPQGAGTMYVFREIIGKINETEELKEECKIFQVYRNNGSMKIDAYNNSRHLRPCLERFIKRNWRQGEKASFKSLR